MQDTAPGWQERAFKEKLCWIEKVGREFGSCGKILLLDGEGAVYSQYGPPEFFPNATEYPSGPLELYLKFQFSHPEGRYGDTVKI
jgi:hypothetical protein